MKKFCNSIFIFFLCVKGFSQGVTTDTTNYLLSNNWDNNSFWTLSLDNGSTATINNYNGLNNNGISVSYSFPSLGGWANIQIPFGGSYTKDNPIVFFVYSTPPASANQLEIKFMDTDGSIFDARPSLSKYSNKWTHLTVYLSNTNYDWGGDTKFDTPASFSIAISGTGNGIVYFDEIGVGKPGLAASSFSNLDPDSTLAGTGFAQRRDSIMNPEDTLVLKYLKVIQDISSSDMALVPSMEDGVAETFNNSMAAIAFVVKDEKERAERILDFYSGATDINNQDKLKQNFYYNGEARGFFQNASIDTKVGSGDRWIGDMAWLLIACKDYEIKYSSTRYDSLINLIKNLFISFYRDYPSYGYVETGWRNGDTSFDTTGHQEGNIDCYVVFKLVGDNYRAQKIKQWEEMQLQGLQNLPLDLYSWRTLAFGKDYASLLNIPEYNYCYRKVINVRGTETMGFYSNSDISVNNFWNDGTGQMSCAFQAFGDKERGYFYANQMDHLIIEHEIGNTLTHTIPYALYKGNSWVDTTKGFSSTAAWYIIAKNDYNPFQSADFKDTAFSDTVKFPNKYNPLIVKSIQADLSIKLYPNPFTSNEIISYFVPEGSRVKITILNMQGVQITTLVENNSLPGSSSITWNGLDSNGCEVNDGIYFIDFTVRGDVNKHSVHKLIKLSNY